MPFSDPSWPVVNPEPTVDDCIKSMRFRDYVMVGAVTSGSWVYGYLGGRPVRLPTAGTAAAIGFTFATFVVLQDTRGRFMGYNENAKEVQRYGMHPIQPAPPAPVNIRTPTATGHSTITKPFNWKNY